MELERNQGQGRSGVSREPKAERDIQLLLLLGGGCESVGVGIVHTDHLRQFFSRFAAYRLPTLQKTPTDGVYHLTTYKHARLAQQSVPDAVHPCRLGKLNIFLGIEIGAVGTHPFRTNTAARQIFGGLPGRAVGIRAQRFRNHKGLGNTLAVRADTALQMERRELDRKVKLVEEVAGAHERDGDRAGAKTRSLNVLGHSLHGKSRVLRDAELKERNRRVVGQVSVHGTDGDNGGNVGGSGHLLNSNVQKGAKSSSLSVHPCMTRV